MLKRIFLLSVFIVLILGVAGGLILYNQSMHKKENIVLSVQNHMGDLRYNFKDHEEVTVIKPPVEVPKGGGTNSATPAVSGGVPVSREVKTNVQQQPSSGNDPSLRDQIEQKYISRIQSTASGYEGRLNGLIAVAFTEYTAARKDNPNAEIGPLVNKYYNAGKALEAECDSQVYSILAAFESELSANSLPLDAAVQARKTYEARKSEMGTGYLSY